LCYYLKLILKKMKIFLYILFIVFYSISTRLCQCIFNKFFFISIYFISMNTRILLGLSSPIVDRNRVLTRLNVLKERSAVQLVAGRDKNISKATTILGKNVQLQFHKSIKSISWQSLFCQKLYQLSASACRLSIL